MTIRVLIADDHFIVRQGMRAVLDDADDIVVVAEARNGREAVAAFEEHRPDVALLDVRMPELSGEQAIAEIRGRHPDARLVAISHYEGDEDIYRCMAAGAATYLIKRTLEDELPETIRATARGEKRISREVADALANRIGRPTLTEREHQALQLMAKGLANKEIASALAISVNTVNTYVAAILLKLGVDHRTEAVAVALQRGLIHMD